MLYTPALIAGRIAGRMGGMVYDYVVTCVLQPPFGISFFRHKLIESTTTIRPHACTFFLSFIFYFNWNQYYLVWLARAQHMAWWHIVEPSTAQQWFSRNCNLITVNITAISCPVGREINTNRRGICLVDDLFGSGCTLYLYTVGSSGNENKKSSHYDTINNICSDRLNDLHWPCPPYELRQFVSGFFVCECDSAINRNIGKCAFPKLFHTGSRHDSGREKQPSSQRLWWQTIFVLNVYLFTFAHI